MKIIYLAAGYAKLNFDNVTYQDKYVKRDIAGDMLDVDLNDYDLIIASPPCNYYSIASPINQNKKSKYALETKHLLPSIIKKCENLAVPVIIENVINKSRMRDIIDNTTLLYYEHGRHCYFTNVMLNLNQVNQLMEYVAHKSVKQRQGGYNVNRVIEYFVKTLL